MKILITGHEGFIGRNATRILKRDFDVLEYDGDIRDWDSNAKFDVDVVLHLAALAGVRKSWNNPEDYWETNVTASKKIFEWCISNTVRCVYASSSSIYEWWKNPYATTKKAMEEIAPANSVGMRFHTVYGPNSRPDMFYDMMLNDKIEYLTTHLRDWTHVEDVVSAIKLILQTPELSGILDIGSETPISVIDVANAYGYRDVPLKEVVGEREVTHADCTALRQLGWQPKFNILEEARNARNN